MPVFGGNTMRSFIVAAALAVTGALGFAGKADAQFYLNTLTPGGGLVISAGTGYYPGLYSGGLYPAAYSYGYGYPLGLNYGLSSYYGGYGGYGGYYRPYYSGYRGWGGGSYRGYGYRGGWGRRWR